jgi:adenine deaminase
MKKTGMIVDLIAKRIFPGEIHIHNGHIASITETSGQNYATFILPGFVDAHIHVESSMLIPSEFARASVRHGIVSTVSDPHEIANVLGTAGVDYMIENGNKTPFKFYFGAPSCVPATTFETAGASIDPDGIRVLLSRPEIVYLSEMMNYPGVVYGQADVMAKIAIAQELKKPIDGHSPGLRGEALRTYISAGISTDHECFTLDEALEKVALGMKIIIREGSAARNFDALHPLIGTHPERCMFCSDDRHPDQLLQYGINDVVKKAIALGYPLFDVLRIACVNPVRHYGLNVGLLQIGDPADFIMVDSLETFVVTQTVINGRTVFSHGQTFIDSVPAETPNHFHATPITSTDLSIDLSGKTIRTIDVHDGQLVTTEGRATLPISENPTASDISQDLLKMVVLNRYTPASKPAIGFVRNFGLKEGAIASSVAHDSHNIVAIGVSDHAIAAAINAIVDSQGGLSVIDAKGRAHVLPLPVAGIMSADPIETVANHYGQLDQLAKSLGSPLQAPFMTLSFLALLVIPKLKLSDLGLFDGDSFVFVDVIVD